MSIINCPPSCIRERASLPYPTERQQTSLSEIDFICPCALALRKRFAMSDRVDWHRDLSREQYELPRKRTYPMFICRLSSCSSV